ncbi:hypothetical protein HK100_008190 [Physocladia obscura]|uniref:Uncharacterized protein n=1 Tax=Physocladia obscura TaxID=109957 RepID=A0AAD5X7W3_9FUNG|nr:hypothetical protein HK100_008190 [Physocladia obscura]
MQLPNSVGVETSVGIENFEDTQLGLSQVSNLTGILAVLQDTETQDINHVTSKVEETTKIEDLRKDLVVNCPCTSILIDSKMLQCVHCKSLNHPNCFGYFENPMPLSDSHVCYNCANRILHHSVTPKYDLKSAGHVALIRRALGILAQAGGIVSILAFSETLGVTLDTAKHVVGDLQTMHLLIAVKKNGRQLRSATAAGKAGGQFSKQKQKQQQQQVFTYEFVGSLSNKGLSPAFMRWFSKDSDPLVIVDQENPRNNTENQINVNTNILTLPLIESTSLKTKMDNEYVQDSCGSQDSNISQVVLGQSLSGFKSSDASVKAVFMNPNESMDIDMSIEAGKDSDSSGKISQEDLMASVRSSNTKRGRFGEESEFKKAHEVNEAKQFALFPQKRAKMSVAMR